MLLWDHFVRCIFPLLILEAAATLSPVQVLLGHADFPCVWVKGAEDYVNVIFIEEQLFLYS